MTVKRSTLKTLWAASGNRCGHPDCEEEVADTEQGIVIGEICHIRAQSEGGPRYDPSLNEDEVDAYSNLILLCPTHHTYIDKNPEEYPIEKLERWKQQQEEQDSTGTELSDELLTELQLTDSKLETEVEVSISNAKDRYTPELHVDTSASNIFEPLGRTRVFIENVENRLEDLDDESSSLFTDNYISVLEEADEDAYLDLREAVENIPELLQDVDQVSDEIPVQELNETLEQADEAIQELEPELRTLKEEAEEETRESTEKRALYRFQQVRSEIYNLQRFADSQDLQVAETPALKLLGKAGMGKTHLLCNVARNRVENGYPTVLVLGENFSDRDVWTQIIERFGLNCTTEEFLSALNSLGKSRGVRSLIMIDALNESPDPRTCKHPSQSRIPTRRTPAG
jgi:signal recognition particle GTPase